jgi:hypothetical protein
VHDTMCVRMWIFHIRVQHMWKAYVHLPYLTYHTALATHHTSSFTIPHCTHHTSPTIPHCTRHTSPTIPHCTHHTSPTIPRCTPFSPRKYGLTYPLFEMMGVPIGYAVCQPRLPGEDGGKESAKSLWLASEMVTAAGKGGERL